MRTKCSIVRGRGFKFTVRGGKKEIGRAYLYVLYNDLHDQPFGLLEDVFVDERCRGQDIGTKLVESVLKKARQIGCYKLVATSRFARLRVHRWYKRLGFKKYGYEFRVDF